MTCRPLLLCVLVLLLAWPLSCSCSGSTPARTDEGAAASSATPAAASDPAANPTPAPAPAVAPTAGSVEEEYRGIALKNACPKGFPSLQGTWRFIGESKVRDYHDELTISGTRLTEAMSGRVGDTDRLEKGELAGEIRCLFKNRVLVMVDKVTPDGAFGNRVGDTYPCDVLGDLSGRGEKMLMICYFDWDLRTAAGLEFEYERIVPGTP